MSAPRIHPAEKLPNRFAVNLESFRKFKFRERVKIMLGWNLQAATKVIIDKRDGRVWSETKLALTTAVTAQDVVEGNMKEDFGT